MSLLNEQEVKEAKRRYQREYQRRWRKNNPEKVTAIYERFWLKKCSQMQKEVEKKYEEKSK